MGSARVAIRPEGGLQHLVGGVVFGGPLTLPGEFIVGPEPPPQEFVDSLRAAPPPPASRQRSYAQVAAKPSFQSPKSKVCLYSPRRHGAVPPAPLRGSVPGNQRRRQVFYGGDRGKSGGGFY